MKVIKTLLVVAFFLISFTYAGELKFLATDYPPYTYEKDGKVKGREAAVAYAIMEKLGYQKKITLLPWNKAYSLTKDYPDYVLFSVARKKDREDHFKWVGPITVQDLVLFENRKNPVKIKKLEDTKNAYTIGVVKNFSTHQYLEKEGYHNLLMVENVTGLVKLLEHERVDLAPFAPEMMPFVMHKNNIPAGLFQATSVKLYTNAFYIAFSKETDDKMIARWQAALDALKKSGEFQKMQEEALQVSLKDFGID